MDDAAFRVHIVEAQQDLFRNLLDDVSWHASMLIPLDQPEQVLSEHFEHHAYVRTIGSSVAEVIKQGHAMSAPGVIRISRN